MNNDEIRNKKVTTNVTPFFYSTLWWLKTTLEREYQWFLTQEDQTKKVLNVEWMKSFSFIPLALSFWSCWWMTMKKKKSWFKFLQNKVDTFTGIVMALFCYPLGVFFSRVVLFSSKWCEKYATLHKCILIKQVYSSKNIWNTKDSRSRNMKILVEF